MTGKRLSILLAVLMLVMVLPLGVMAAKQYTDVKGHWAEEHIKWASDKGLVQGYPDGEFKPNGEITNAEFARIVNQVLLATEKADINFADVDKDAWFYEEVQKAVKVGYIKDGGNFNGNQAITRDEAFRILAYIYNLSADEALLKDYVDFDQINNKKEVAGLFEKKIVDGYPDNTIRPTATITRAEAAKIFHTADGLNLTKIDLNKKVEEKSEEKKDESKTESSKKKGDSMWSAYITPKEEKKVEDNKRPAKEPHKQAPKLVHVSGVDKAMVRQYEISAPDYPRAVTFSYWNEKGDHIVDKKPMKYRIPRIKDAEKIRLALYDHNGKELYNDIVYY